MRRREYISCLARRSKTKITCQPLSVSTKLQSSNPSGNIELYSKKFQQISRTPTDSKIRRNYRHHAIKPGALKVSRLFVGRTFFKRLQVHIRRLNWKEMFSLMYGLWKYMVSKTEFHVLILGIDKAGKTTLLERLKALYSNVEGLPPDRIVPTVGLNIGRLEVANSKLVFWDLGGQSGLRSIWEKYYEEAHAVIFVIDAASPSRFEDSKSALEKALRHEDLQGAPLLILANKQDLPEAASAEELARYLDLKKLDERVYMFEAVSAYDGMGIKGSLEWLVEVMERSKRTETLRARVGYANAPA